MLRLTPSVRLGDRSATERRSGSSCRERQYAIPGTGELLHALHCAAQEFRSPPAEESLWTLDNETHQYHWSLKSGYSTLMFYAARKARDNLRGEQKATTSPHAGLHVFEPRKLGE